MYKVYITRFGILLVSFTIDSMPANFQDFCELLRINIPIDTYNLSIYQIDQFGIYKTIF